MRVFSAIATAFVFYVLLLMLVGTSACTRTVRPQYPEPTHACDAEGAYVAADGTRWYAECCPK